MRKVKFLIALLCLSCMTLNAQVASEVPSLIGSWTGKLNMGAVSLALVFNFECAGDDVVCTMDSPDQGAKGIRMATEFLQPLHHRFE